mmetsp:Transcript_128957/g.360834  ORF Transcript_128957/g.360834 Transcript_128957/m.360834 type:complete len:313 (+) Transcript_128957:231-1169(+)
MDYSIRTFGGACLTAPEGSANGAGVMIAPCVGNASQHWVYIVETGRIKNDLCLDAPRSGKLHLWRCHPIPTQSWSFDLSTGQLKASTGRCLEAPTPSEHSQEVLLAPCHAGNVTQMWSVAAWMLPSAHTTTAAMSMPEPGATPDVPPSGQHSAQESAAPQAPRKDRAIRNADGSCLDATEGAKNGGHLQTSPCDEAAAGQRWSYDGRNLKNKICIDSPRDRWVHMWQCHPIDAQSFEHNVSTGLLRVRRGASLCLEASSVMDTVHISACDASRPSQIWSLGELVREDAALLQQAPRAVRWLSWARRARGTPM